MRCPRLQLRLGWIMVVVAIVALGLALVREASTLEWDLSPYLPSLSDGITVLVGAVVVFVPMRIVARLRPRSSSRRRVGLPFVLLGLTAFACWMFTMRQLSEDYRTLAHIHYRHVPRMIQVSIVPPWFDAWQDMIHKQSPERIAWHDELSHKYEFAADYPWLPIAPDPPGPN